MSADPDPRVTALAPLIGRWRMTTSLVPEGTEPPSAETTFEWLDGGHFVVQRWSIDVPEAPGGIAVIGIGEAGDLRQSYFDSRGVARVYGVAFDGRTLRLERHVLGFSQRFVGELSEDGDTLDGAWLLDTEGTWEQDFALTYHRIAG